jgi:hypothetical protein
MMRRPLVLVALSLVTLTLAACSDVTAPTTSEPQIGATTTAGARACSGGYGTSTGKC